jgi:hypothetical protein
MNYTGKNGYVREPWAGGTSVEAVKRYAAPSISLTLAMFFQAAESNDTDAMFIAANNLRRVSTRLTSFARMKQRQKRKQEATESVHSN